MVYIGYGGLMEQVGVRQLRQNPTPVLRAVEAGAEVAVTVNGRYVARIVPFESAEWVDGLRANQLFAAQVDDDWTDELVTSRQAESVDDPWT